MLLKVLEDGRKVWKETDRSYPQPWIADRSIAGFVLDAEGPMHLRNVEFSDFPANEFTGAKPCNILFEEYRFLMGAVSSVEGRT